jgi:hypothetical protein
MQPVATDFVQVALVGVAWNVSGAPEIATRNPFQAFVSNILA